MSIDSNNIIVPPPPYASPVQGPNGQMSVAWSKWINQLYLRAGGTSSPSTAGIVSDIQILQASVGNLNTEVIEIKAELLPLNEGLTVGRQL